MSNRFLPVDEAKRRIFDEVKPIRDAEMLHVRDALGRICARDVISPIDVPSHANSAMDGYSFSIADLGGGERTGLRTLGRAMAGAPYSGDPAGGCVKIMTGAVVPSGHDAVIPKEDVLAEDDGGIELDPSKVRAHQNLRFPGEDLKEGEVAVAAGKLVRPAEIGLVASLGIGEVAAVRRPRVAFFSTGDELRSIGEPLAEGCIYDSNRYTLFSMIRRMGFDPVDLGVVPDDPGKLRGAIDRAQECDAIITSGGVSVGEADHVKELLEKAGEVVFWKIAMKPGRPLAFGRLGESLFFGLPGNPVSVMVTFYVIVQPALWRLAGRSDVPPLPLVRAKAAEPIRKAPGRMEYQRCTLETAPDGGLLARPTGAQGSGILKSMSSADALLMLGTEVGDLEEGSPVDVLPLEGIA